MNKQEIVGYSVKNNLWLNTSLLLLLCLFLFLIHRDRALGFQRKFSIDPQSEESEFSLEVGHESQTLPKPKEQEPSITKPRAWETSLSLKQLL